MKYIKILFVFFFVLSLFLLFSFITLEKSVLFSNFSINDIKSGDVIKIKFLAWNPTFKKYPIYNCPGFRIEGHEIYESEYGCPDSAGPDGYLYPFIPKYFKIEYKIVTDPGQLYDDPQYNRAQMPIGTNKINFVWSGLKSKTYLLNVSK